MTASALILELCSKVLAKRPRAVIDHILHHGQVTTEEIQALGYDHPPRAVRDVREHGIPLETFRVKSSRTGRSIAAYRFADPSKIRAGRIGGRRAFPKRFKEELIAKYGEADAITGDKVDAVYLQIDHRIPYEIAGDSAELRTQDFMLLDAASQRAKSWQCEHCRNWTNLRNPSTCASCYWAAPESYSHVALSPVRRIDIVLHGEDVSVAEHLAARAARAGTTLSEFIKQLLRDTDR